jgi:hypothetical protein
MPQIAMPADLGAELMQARYWYSSAPELAAFFDHVQAGHGWTSRRPRALLRWAAEHAIQTFGHRRFVALINTGFDGPDRWRLWRVAATSLRAALGAITRGEESEAAYADGRELLSFAEGPPRRWGPTGSEAAGAAMVFPSPVGPAPEAVGVPPPPPAAPAGGPSAPRGQWLTR